MEAPFGEEIERLMICLWDGFHFMDPGRAKDDVISRWIVHDIKSCMDVDAFGKSWRYDFADGIFLCYVPITKTHTFKSIFEDDVA